MTVRSLENVKDEQREAQVETDVMFDDTLTEGVGAIVPVPEREVDVEFAVTILVEVKTELVSAELAGAVRDAEVAFPDGTGLPLAAETVREVESTEVELAKLTLALLLTLVGWVEVELEDTRTVDVAKTVEF